MENQAKMQVKLIDYAKQPLEKLYAAFRTCYSCRRPSKSGTRSIRENHPRKDSRFITDRLKTGPLLRSSKSFSGSRSPTCHARCASVRAAIGSGFSFEQQSQRYVKLKHDKLTSCCLIHGHAPGSRMKSDLLADVRALREGVESRDPGRGCALRAAQRRATNFT